MNVSAANEKVGFGARFFIFLLFSFFGFVLAFVEESYLNSSFSARASSSVPTAWNTSIWQSERKNSSVTRIDSRVWFLFSSSFP